MPVNTYSPSREEKRRPASGKQSGSRPAHPVLRLQEALGNRGVHRLLRSGVIQPKLEVSRPGDRYELEADRVAEAVVSMPEPGTSCCHQPAHAGGPRVQRMCSACEEELLLQPKEDAGGTREAAPSIEPHVQHQASAGRPLPDSVRAYFEPRFGYDFSQVRIHTDSNSAAKARAISAKAYTVGSDIVFAQSQFAPETPAGKLLLAHELAHVVQQQAAGSTALQAQSESGVRVFEDCECLMETMNRVNEADTALELAKEETVRAQGNVSDGVAAAGLVCTLGLAGGLAGGAACAAALFAVRRLIRDFEKTAQAQIRAEQAVLDAEANLEACQNSCKEEPQP
jgi:hypothetical protein